MSVSPQQLAANRANAKSSTGPQTPAGLANCKLNATKHGLTSARVVLLEEDQDAYDTLHASFVEAYNPQNEIEAMLVEQVSTSWWRLLRADRVEADLIDHLGGLEACFRDPQAARIWNNFVRYRAAIQRVWRHAVDELERLAAARRKHGTLNTASNGSVSKHPPQEVVTLRKISLGPPRAVNSNMLDMHPTRDGEKVRMI